MQHLTGWLATRHVGRLTIVNLPHLETNFEVALLAQTGFYETSKLAVVRLQQGKDAYPPLFTS